MDNISKDNFTIFKVLSEGNPGACKVLIELMQNVETITLDEFFITIMNKEIVGARLWYIYKNECNQNVNELVDKDLTPFTNSYFYEKFEKYL